MTQEQEARIMDAYAAYDADKRANGPDDFDAFLEAVAPLLEPAGAELLTHPEKTAYEQGYCQPGEAWT